ncbi:unnamed protein product, partial [Symbiodinium sp. CCMP2592]
EWNPQKNEDFLLAMMDEPGFMRAFITAVAMLLGYLKGLAAFDGDLWKAPVLVQLICAAGKHRSASVAVALAILFNLQFELPSHSETGVYGVGDIPLTQRGKDKIIAAVNEVGRKLGIKADSPPKAPATTKAPPAAAAPPAKAMPTTKGDSKGSQAAAP